MAKRYHLLLCLLFLPFLSIKAQSPHFELYNVMRNKKDVKVNTIFQDRSGFIWIGTNQGLVKGDF